MNIQAISSPSYSYTQPFGTKAADPSDDSSQPTTDTVNLSDSSTLALMASINQEASETIDQTMLEASRGDTQAMRKLEKIEDQNTASQVQPSTNYTSSNTVPESTGTIINVMA